MNYENYIELYEAVYLFYRFNKSVGRKLPKLLSPDEIISSGVDDSIYHALLKILVVNKLLKHDGVSFKMTQGNQKKIQHILENIIKKDPHKQYTIFYDKAINASHYFFDQISESEYDVYSRCDFDVTFNIGKIVAKHLDLANQKVLELGGNSGGLGTALVLENENCHYTIVDTKIPCKVGNEFKQLNDVNLTFAVDNIFELMLPIERNDYIVLMNILHDFDDESCLSILQNCIKHSDKNTKFLIIEDVLTSSFEPKNLIMHGLRLSVECRGGRQRTSDELTQLFSNIDYGFESTVKIDSIHSMMVMGAL
ncbi:methyltransferase [Fusibacter bizertensis]